MLKRVNIQYTIDLDELPNEVDRIYLTAKNLFNELTIPEKSGKELLTSEVLKDIDEARKSLANLDHILNDVSGIVGAYVNYELSLINSQNTSPDGTEANVENSAEVP
jgi:hypothetical protein